MRLAQETEAPLAIHGGRAVRTTPLPYGRHRIDEDDIQAVVDVLRSDWITTGPKVAEFEQAFAEYMGGKHAVSFSSGTGALHGAAFAAGLGPGDEAVTTPLTFCATANCVLYQGARPVFADVLPDTLTVDPDETARRITPRTKALLPVDYAGHPADIQPLAELADRLGLLLIEDASHALGATYRGRPLGSAHMTVFSFHPVKHLTTGEGGMVLTNDAELARRLRLFRNHGIDRDARERQAEGVWRYAMVALGYNYRLTDIACALGLSQLGRLDATLLRRREIAARYTAEFQDVPGLLTPAVRPNVQPAWHFYPILLDLHVLRAGRDEILGALRAEGLGVTVHYMPVHLHPYYRNRYGYRSGDYPVSEDAYERLISLPLSHGMADRDVEDVIRAVRKVLSHYAI